MLRFGPANLSILLFQMGYDIMFLVYFINMEELMARKLIYEDEYLRCTHVVTPEPDSSVLNACVCDSSLIYYNIQGEKRAVIEGNTYSLHPGDLLIVSKLDAFYVHEDSSDCSEYMICTFSRYIFRHLDPEFSFMKSLIRQYRERQICCGPTNNEV